MDSIKINIKIKAEDIFNFLLTHAYTRKSGIITGVFGIVCLILFPFSFFWHDIFVTIILFFSAVIYLGLTPLSLYSNAKRQMLSNPIFKHNITYTFTNKGMDISQYVNSSNLTWDKIKRVRETSKSFLFYINDEQAFILPKRMIETEEETKQLKSLIRKKAKNTKIIFKK